MTQIVPRAEPERRAEPDWRRLDAVLRRFFARRVADPELRADLVQLVLLRVVERGEQLREDERLEAWVFRIARNTLVDHHRRHRPQDPLPELQAPEPEPENLAPRVLGAWLREQIAGLEPRYSEVLELTDLRGHSQREAAAALGLPYSTVKSRVQRGRERLHAELLGCCAVEVDARGRITDFERRAVCVPCGCGDQKVE